MEWIQQMDISLLTGLREALSSPFLDKPMVFISALGDGGFFWIVWGVLFLYMGNRERPWRSWGWLLLFCLGATALVCNLWLKPWVARMRPYDLLGFEILIPHLSDFSFPSGHTSASFAAATAIYAMDKRWGMAAYVFGGIMGISRMYLGVHFPSDVLAGAIIGFLVAKFVCYLWKRKMQFLK